MDSAVCDKCVQFTQLFGVVDEIRQRGAVIRGKVFLHNLQAFVDSFADGNTGYDNDELAPTVAFIQFEDGFDVDNKELEEKKLADAVSTVSKINASISRREELFLCHEGSMPFIKTRIINPLFNRFQMSPKHFYATDACIGCKRCEKSCPMENVTVVDGRPVWGMDCTSCLACYHVCPQHAVQYGKRTKDKGQYFNPNQSTRL